LFFQEAPLDGRGLSPSPHLPPPTLSCERTFRWGRLSLLLPLPPFRFGFVPPFPPLPRNFSGFVTEERSDVGLPPPIVAVPSSHHAASPPLLYGPYALLPTQRSVLPLSFVPFFFTSFPLAPPLLAIFSPCGPTTRSLQRVVPFSAGMCRFPPQFLQAQPRE